MLYFLEGEALVDRPDLLFDLQEFLVGEFVGIEEWVAIEVGVLSAPLVVDFPPEVVVLVPVLGELVPEGLDLGVVGVPHREQLLMLFLLVVDFFLDAVDVLSESSATFEIYIFYFILSSLSRMYWLYSSWYALDDMICRLKSSS